MSKLNFRKLRIHSFFIFAFIFCFILFNLDAKLLPESYADNQNNDYLLVSGHSISVQFPLDETYFFGGFIGLYDLRNNKYSWKHRTHDGSVKAFLVSKNDKFVIHNQYNSQAIRNIKTGKRLFTMTDQAYFTFTDDGNFLFAEEFKLTRKNIFDIPENIKINMWDMNTFTVAKSFLIELDPLDFYSFLSLKCSPDNKFFVLFNAHYQNNDIVFKIVSIENGAEQLIKARNEKTSFSSVAIHFSNDGKHLIVGISGDRILIYSFPAMQLENVIYDDLRNLGILPDGMHLIGYVVRTSNWTINSINIYDINTGLLINKIATSFPCYYASVDFDGNGNLFNFQQSKGKVKIISLDDQRTLFDGKIKHVEHYKLIHF